MFRSRKARPQAENQYLGTDGSTSALQASMPPAMLWQAGTPCSRSQCATFKLRTPWWQNTINVVSSALASSCCKLAGISRMGINVAPSMRVMANSSGSRTSISASGSPASIRRWMSSGLVSIGRIVSLTNLRIAQWKITSLDGSDHLAASRAGFADSRARAMR